MKKVPQILAGGRQFMDKGEILQLPNYQLDGYTLNWRFSSTDTTLYTYDPNKNTFMFNDSVDDETNFYLTACYIKNESN